MADRTPSALIKALRAVGLVDLVADDTVTTTLYEMDSVLHSQYGCEVVYGPTYRRRESTPVARPWFGSLSNPQVCRDKRCVRHLVRGTGASNRVTWTLTLLSVHDTIRAAQRHIADPTRSAVVGSTSRLRAQADTDLSTLAKTREAAARCPDVVAACGRAEQLVLQAREALGSPEVEQARRGQILDRVHHEMLGHHARLPLRLEDTETLAGLIGRGSAPRKVEEVIEVLTVAGNKSFPLLIGPRYAIDYIHRHYAVGSNAHVTILTVPADGLDRELVRAAAALWSPMTPGPLGGLEAALTAARDVLAS